MALPSVQSLIVTLLANGQAIGTATGFVVMKGDEPYFITNWHVVSGLSPHDGQPRHSMGALPDALTIYYTLPQTNDVVQWQPREEKVLDDQGRPLWLEHPYYNRKVDVVALPLRKTAGMQLLPYELNMTGNVPVPGVADPVSIVGFPFGRTAAGLTAIWVRGSIASEPELNFNELPCFLVDARTRPGQSGSPVIFHSTGGVMNMSDGTMAVIAGTTTLLLGIYSGRLTDSSLVDQQGAREDSSDLGIVWRRELIDTILQHGVSGNNQPNV